MGGALTVCNRSNVPLHLSLDQLGPLYFENFVQPEQCMQRATGRVWFTINARLASANNIITTAQGALPIIATVTAVIVLVATAGMANAVIGAGDIVVAEAGTVSGALQPAWLSGEYSALSTVTATNIAKEAANSLGARLLPDLTVFKSSGLVFAMSTTVEIPTALSTISQAMTSIASQEGTYANGATYYVDGHADVVHLASPGGHTVKATVIHNLFEFTINSA